MMSLNAFTSAERNQIAVGVMQKELRPDIHEEPALGDYPPDDFIKAQAQHVRRVAKAYRSGLSLPGCGDPECRGCMPPVIKDPALDQLLTEANTPEPDDEAPPTLNVLRAAPREGEKLYRLSDGTRIALLSKPSEPFSLIPGPEGVH